MRLLIRRYVTAEQRKRDEFGITEDDVMEIRQDISTLRYELIDILRQNGMRTPTLDKQDAALSGKKGRVMERRLQKDFQIGIVEGIVNAVIQSEKEPKDVFSQIAKAIGRKSSGSKKKDWNAMVRKNTFAKDPIGSTTEATMKQTRRSIRRHLQTQNSDLASLDPNRLVDYNPNLLEVSPTTRIAYAKFMIGRARPIPEQKEGESKSDVEGSQKSVRIVTEPVSATPILKKTLLKSLSSGSLEKGGEKAVSIEVRAPSPIPEDPKEGEVGNSPQGKVGLAKNPTDTKPLSEKEEGDRKNTEDEEKKKREEEEKKKKEMEEEKKKEEERKKDEGEKKKDEGEKKKDEGEKKKDEGEKKKDEGEKKKESSSEPSKPAAPEDNVPVATTKLRGKSKATGQIMGGWI